MRKIDFCDYLPFALKDGVLVEIKNVERGLKCDCFCPNCNSKLIAKKGNIRVHHFAHAYGSDCKMGLESALHLASKRIFSENKLFYFPDYLLKIDPYTEEYLFIKNNRFEYTSVNIEKRINDIIPDILLSNESDSILIEIFVTHRLNKEKIEIINSLEISCIEIDLSKYKNQELSFEILERILIYDLTNKNWLFHKGQETFIKSKLEEIKLGWHGIDKPFDIEVRMPRWKS